LLKLDHADDPISKVALEQNGIFEVRNDKAIAAGLTFRPLPDTIRDTLE
jgi:hypothetical protein